uniref:Sel1 repeat family protein n=1 Tax=OCS116 cluster bacterium TaxID=2030921 RepID=A0A2A4YTP0_9PROT
MSNLEKARIQHVLANFDNAYEICKTLAAQGNGEAQYYIAGYFENGLSVEKNRETAYKFYKQSAENGFTPSIQKVKLIELNYGSYMKS